MDLEIMRDTDPWDWPEDAGATLLRTLKDQQASENQRQIAASLAGDYTVIDDELAEALLAVVQDPKAAEGLRAAAAIGFGPALENAEQEGFEDPDELLISEELFWRIQETLQRLFSDESLPKQVRRRILEASVRAPQEWHRHAVSTAYSSADPLWRLTAVFCMSYIDGFEDQIIEALGSADPDIRFEAVRAAGNQAVDDAFPQVSALALSEGADKSLRLAAIEALAGIRPNEALGILDDLTISEDEDVANTAQEALAMTEGFLEFEEEDDEDDVEDEEEDQPVVPG